MSASNMNISLTIPVMRSVEGDDLTGYILAQHKKWDALNTYTGPYKLIETTLKGPPEQVLPISVASKIIEIFVEKFKSGGYSPMEMKVWANNQPTFYTNYKVEFKVYAPESTATAGLAEMHLVQAIPVIAYAIATALIAIAIAITVWKVTDVATNLINKAGPIGVLIIIVLIAYVVATSREKKKEKSHV